MKIAAAKRGAKIKSLKTAFKASKITSKISKDKKNAEGNEDREREVESEAREALLPSIVKIFAVS